MVFVVGQLWEIGDLHSITGLPQTLQVIVPFFDRTSSLPQIRQFVK
jgi:hypothetical protein